MYVSQYVKIATFVPFFDAAPHIIICMIWNTCNFIKRIEQVVAEQDISAIEDYIIII